LATYYCRLIAYAATSNALVFHILWNNKFEIFDRTLLTLYYRLCGKRLTLTVHNVNAGRRDGNDSWINRLTLRIQYHLMHHVFVHTDRMKRELIADFGVPDASITVIPFGINNAVPQTAAGRDESRLKLGIGRADKTILFFGTIAPYKGLEYLVDAFHRLVGQDPTYRLVIAGKPRPGDEQYWRSIADTVERGPEPARVLQHIRFIPDQDTEQYFKAADVAILPYTHIFQSGVLFLAYSFGLPVIAADVGDLKEDILIGETGDVFPPKDPAALSSSIETYFLSSLYRELESRRAEIRAYAEAQHSWETVAERTVAVYRGLLSHGSARVVDTV
jgi:glycosyltransferase involved in cell wall biosynthesis